MATGDNSIQTELTVDFAGEVHTLSPGEELTFGRGTANDLEIDSNPQLHRKFGYLYFRDGSWWLRNNGNRLVLNVLDQQSRSSATITAGLETPLMFQKSKVRFEAGTTSYELLFELSVPPMPLEDFNDDTVDADEGSGLMAMTIDQSQVPLVGDQRLLAVALSENKLRNPHKPTNIPTNKAVAHRFGWAMTTFNRKLDRMCKKYARAGVSGLVGAPGELASDRRTKLVEHLVASGSVTLADLDLLAEIDNQQP